MKKLTYSIFAAIAILFLFVSVKMYAIEDTASTFEKKYAEVGYKSIEESVKDFQEFCKCEVRLPKALPPIPFTHVFGKFSEDKKYINDILEIRYVHENKTENIFKIDIKLLENKMEFKGKEYLLEDGTKAVYFEREYFNFMVFEKNNLQFLMGISNKIIDIDPGEELVRLANSI
ncbi:MAG: carbon monoxide dehydrogenase [Sporosarcina sp.]